MTEPTVKGTVESADIYQYYHAKIDNAENDDLVLNKLSDDLKIPIDLSHKQEWELKKRREEHSNLQKTAAEVELALLEERNQVIRSKTLINHLEKENKESDVKNNELLALTGTVEQEVKFYKDTIPEKTQKFPIANPYGSAKKSKTQSVVKKMLAQPCPKPKNVLRTIYIPSEQANCMKAEVDQLKIKMAEQQSEYSVQIEKLKNERLQREEIMREEYIAYLDRLKEVEDKIEKETSNCYLMTRDLVDLKYLSENEERKLHEECHALRLENEEFRRNIISTIERGKQEQKNMVHEMSKVSNEVIQQLKFEGQRKSESLMIIKEQYERIQQIYKNRVQTLAELLEKKSKKCTDLKVRNSLELEGYQRDIESIRRKLGIYMNTIENRSKENNDSSEEAEQPESDEKLNQEDQKQLENPSSNNSPI